MNGRYYIEQDNDAKHTAEKKWENRTILLYNISKQLSCLCKHRIREHPTRKFYQKCIATVKCEGKKMKNI